MEEFEKYQDKYYEQIEDHKNDLMPWAFFNEIFTYLNEELKRQRGMSTQEWHTHYEAKKKEEKEKSQSLKSS